ncbi:MAG: DTW domain-containing protein [Calothrix sp. SM1_5_4]|nr:DTW domain-containing protein [Calothrix sp. SM1_5_4]
MNTDRFHLRAESSPTGMATLKAIACALRVLEGEEAFAALHGLYEAKLRATLRARGVLK